MGRVGRPNDGVPALGHAVSIRMCLHCRQIDWDDFEQQLRGLLQRYVKRLAPRLVEWFREWIKQQPGSWN